MTHGTTLTEEQLFHPVISCLKKNQNTPRPSEHPPVMGGSKAANTKPLHGI